MIQLTTLLEFKNEIDNIETLRIELIFIVQFEL